jgi:hypothetical protein
MDLSAELTADQERQNHEDHAALLEDYARAKNEYDKEFLQWRRSKDQSTEQPEEPIRPAAKRHRVDDVTIEAMVPILQENPRGLLAASDELRGWFAAMGLYSSSGKSGRDESKWLEIYGGRSISLDRKTGREHTYIPSAGVSVTGTIQPSILEKCVSDGQVESGMLARILVAMPTPRPKQWTDAVMPEDVRSRMLGVVRRLQSLEFSLVDDRPCSSDHSAVA